ncbi:MAG TPA: sigma factor-like helix-turn-helix DNA-binding protein, partial [Chitinophagaceae bacterium]|nr:sigma factor-like helix-turn-helix DNA-binding protein [Chitinophagaceae bacterium]
HGKTTTPISDRMIDTNQQEEADKSALLQNDKAYELMNESLKELNAEQQQCVTLFYLQKMSYQQVSEATGYSMLQVKSHIQNGKRNLKILIERKLKEHK